MFNKHDPYNPKLGYIYAVSSGKYLGNFFVYMETKKDNTNVFLVIPKMDIQKIIPSDFKAGIDNNILEFQEKLPSKVYKVCTEQYKKVKSEVNN
jgi:hypothetical protein